MPLSPEQVAAAQGMFSAPAPMVSSMPQEVPMAPPPMPLDGGVSGGAPPMPMMSEGPPAPPLDGGMSMAPVAAPGQTMVRGAPAMSGNVVQAAQSNFRQPESFQRDPRPAPRPAPPGGGGGFGKLTKQRDADRAAFDATFDQEQAADADILAAKQQQNTLQADHFTDQARRIEEDAAIQRQEARQVQETHAAYLAKTDAMIDDLAKQKIDPNGLFHSGDAARDVTFGIGAMLMSGLSTYGSSMNGGPNVGVAMLDKMTDRYIAAEESKLANARTAIQARQTVYGQMRELAGDARQAAALFKVAAAEASKNQLDAIVASSSNPVLKAQASKLYAQLERDQQGNRVAVSNGALQSAQASAAASANAQRAQLAADREFQLKVAKLKIEQQEADQKGADKGAAKDKDLGKATAEYAQQLEKGGLPAAEANIEALKRNLPKPGQDIPGLDGWSKLKSGAARMAALPASIVAPMAAPEAADRAVLGKEELLNRKNVEALALEYQNAITGSGGSEAEAKRIAATFYGAGSAAELWDTIAKADDAIKARKANLQAGYGPEVTSQYAQNMSGTVRPPVSSFTPGLKK